MKKEFLKFQSPGARALGCDGLDAYNLTREETVEAVVLNHQHTNLSLNDCLVMVTAINREDAILLTGDGKMRKVAKARGVCVHGVLWIVDQLRGMGEYDVDALISALEFWRKEKTVFLPECEIERRLSQLYELKERG